MTTEFTASQNYDSNDGYSLPSSDATCFAGGGNGQFVVHYFGLSNGPEMFQLIAGSGAVPEPSSFALLGSAAAILVLGTLVGRKGVSRFRWSPAGQAS